MCDLIGIGWQLLFGIFLLGSCAWEIPLGFFVWKLSFVILRLGPSLGCFAWKVSLEDFHSEAFAWELSFWIFRSGTFDCDLSLDLS